MAETVKHLDHLRGLRELTDDQLEARLAELREEESKLRFRSATESLENPMRFRVVRRDIARIRTLLGEKRAK